MLTPSESNAQQSLPLTLLVSQLIELATDHANHLGIGFIKLDPKGLGWVLSRITVEMKHWPRVGERYRLSTWVETLNRHFSERCFSVENEKGEILGYSRSVWMVIDLSSHKSAGTGGVEFNQDLIPGRECPIKRQMRHKPFEPDKIREYTFQYTDLDFYRHVNTVRYIALLLNQFPLSCYDENLLSRFEIAFMNEAKYGETARLCSLKEETATEDLLSDSLLSEEISGKSETTTFTMNVGDKSILCSRITFTSLKKGIKEVAP